MAVTEESFLSGNLSAQPAAPDGQKKESMLDAPEKSHPHWMEHYSAFPTQVHLHDPASKMRGSCFSHSERSVLILKCVQLNCDIVRYFDIDIRRVVGIVVS